MDIISDREIDRLEREAQKQERETYGICPIMGVGGHQCNSGCEWYIKDQGCAISVIAKNIGYGVTEHKHDGYKFWHPVARAHVDDVRGD